MKCNLYNPDGSICCFLATHLLKTFNIFVAQWEDVAHSKAQLEEEQKAAAAADGQRKQFLEDKTNDALELAEKLQREDGSFGEHVNNGVLCGCLHEAFNN